MGIRCVAKVIFFPKVGGHEKSSDEWEVQVVNRGLGNWSFSVFLYKCDNGGTGIPKY